MFLWLLIACIMITGLIIFAGFMISAPAYKGPESDHFDGKRFYNPGGQEAKAFKDVLKWGLKRKQGIWYQETAKPAVSEDIYRNDGYTKITFINHASFLMQVQHSNILTDPVFCTRASPFQWIGPKRTRPPGIQMQALPAIHYILISHNHYDHLDIHALTRIVKQYNPVLIVPLGVSLFLRKHGITNVYELDWWMHKTFDNAALQITAVPAQHFSGRGMFDKNKTLWTGYVIQGSGKTFYFAGDTGLNKHYFQQISRAFPAIDLSFLPIGAYKPSWFMKPIHISPEEAVSVHKILGSKQSIAMHFGTFPMADESKDDAANDFKKARTTHKLSENDFILPAEGETISV